MVTAREQPLCSLIWMKYCRTYQRTIKKRSPSTIRTYEEDYKPGRPNTNKEFHLQRGFQCNDCVRASACFWLLRVSHLPHRWQLRNYSQTKSLIRLQLAAPCLSQSIEHLLSSIPGVLL